MYCTFLWKILICGKYTLERRRSQAVCLLSGMLAFFSTIPLFFIIPPLIICMTFKTLQNGGQLLLGFNYKQPEVISYHREALAYYSRILGQWRPVAGLLQADRWRSKAAQQRGKRTVTCNLSKCVNSGQHNKYNTVLCSILLSQVCLILKSIDSLSMWLKEGSTTKMN